jgi:thiol-disulfide isomerase/thioredoxin
MPEQDDADVIERAPRRFNVPAIPGLPSVRGGIGTGRRRLVVITAACALLVTAATLVTLRLSAEPRTDPVLARLVSQVTTVPVGHSVPGLPVLPASASSSAGAYSSTLLIDPGSLSAVSGPPLTLGGKPELLYVATEYCPYCAMENWPLIVALSRFGQFTGLTMSRSPEFEHIAPVDSWTFYGSHYTSTYLSFAPVEQRSNVLVNPKANPDAAKSYQKLQQLTPAQQALSARYDKTGSTPFLDFGNRAAQTGSGAIAAQLMTGRSWSQLAAALRQPKTDLGSALLTEADFLTAEICHLTGDRPASACPSFIRTLGLPS